MFVHLFFIIVHLLCLLGGVWLLMFSVPLHIIVSIMRGNKKKMDRQNELLEEQNRLMKRQLEADRKTPKFD